MNRQRLRSFLAVIVLCSPVLCNPAAPDTYSGWVAARSSHFEVFSQAGAARAQETLIQFEQLRAFFSRDQLIPAAPASLNSPPVRVIEFKSGKDFADLKPRAIADAFYSGEGDRNYIVTVNEAKQDLSIAAHEYTHVAVHRAGLHLPEWLNEGLAETFSTLTLTPEATGLGGPIAARVQTLRGQTWLPVQDLLTAAPDSPIRQTHAGAGIFYAESWALVDLLTASPAYASHFPELLGLLNGGGITSVQAFARLYGKSPQQVLADAQVWIAQKHSSRRTLAVVVMEPFASAMDALTEFQARKLLADLLLINGALDRARLAYQELLRQAPGDPEILAALGTVLLRHGEPIQAAGYWRQALDAGLHDAPLCYRYALLAEDLQWPAQEVQRALQRAVDADSHFDDARYKLATLHSSAGDYAAAVNQLESMAKPAPERAFAYWALLSNSLSELNRRGEAEDAARQASAAARTPDEQSRAVSLLFIARTDLTVRFARAADGTLQLQTTRIPHGSADFNPFVEPDDQLQIATGHLQEVQCHGGKLTAFVIESQGKTLTLAVPDPLHVLMRHSPAEFNCGPQDRKPVKVEYAAQPKPALKLLRGMDFQ